ncbi:ABC-type branched-subunit amino acid transport system permease subunit [Variovorax sp. GrIS 2.14]|uniref:hypothetical protein n=1 Tax=Variovorax sp. GrIS 2.14 TaxID=3071709 RepID=UPI0038F70B42
MTYWMALACVVAAFGAGLAGAMYFVGNLRISPDATFSVNGQRSRSSWLSLAASAALMDRSSAL